MSIDLDDPIALMLVTAAALEQSGTECAAYGGLALGMHGEPRETRDAEDSESDRRSDLLAFELYRGSS